MKNRAEFLYIITFAITLSSCAPKTVVGSPTQIDDITSNCVTFQDNFKSETVRITSSQPVSATSTLPNFCQITGTIKPNIGFEARLPLANWNRKYFQAGCGGFCGVILADKETHSNAINHALRRGYATITTDAGHEGLHLGDGRWAKDNPIAEEVYAHKTFPLTLEAEHQLIKLLYNDQPEYSYFSGCSNGGRMGAIAAQRYPALFDGIISGCP